MIFQQKISKQLSTWRPVLIAGLLLIVLITSLHHVSAGVTTPLQPTILPHTPASTSQPKPKNIPIMQPSTKSVGAAKQPVAVTATASTTQVPKCAPTTAKVIRADSGSQAYGVFINDYTSRYAVYGNDVDQVNAQLFSCGPAISGEHFAASTDYSISWAYGFAIQGSLCKIQNINVTMNILEVFPSWNQIAGADSQLAGRWAQFGTNLQTHEGGHAQIDRQYAQLLFDDLNNISASDCSTIDAKASQIANTKLSNLNAANEHYDALTNHGVTQGATL